MNSFFTGFGGNTHQSNRRTQERGKDVEISIRLTFEEALLGTKKTVTFTKETLCTECSGSGAKKGTTPKTCPVCGGSGQVRKRMQTVFGIMEQAGTCDHCHGSGQVIETPCETCHGKKYVRTQIKKEIEMPAGIENGMTLKLTGEGGEAVNGHKGDLYVIVECPMEEDGLVRQKTHLHYILEVSAVEMILGCEKKVKIPVLGERTLEIKAGTQHGEIVKFKHDGVRQVGTDRKGDLLLELHIKIPHKINKEERELYEKLAKLHGSKPKDHKDGGILDKLFGE